MSKAFSNKKIAIQTFSTKTNNFSFQNKKYILLYAENIFDILYLYAFK